MNIPRIKKLRLPLDWNGRGPAVSDLELASAVRSDACVLFTGRKETVQAVAHRIHNLSGWRQGPFTIVDCAGSEEALESELFGVFADTDPSSARQPFPRLAQAGTILLQDVWRLPLEVQHRLADQLVHLRRKRLRGRSTRRLMASSSEPLLPRVLDGTFDDRLFYRLNVIHVVIPVEGRDSGKNPITRGAASADRPTNERAL